MEDPGAAVVDERGEAEQEAAAGRLGDDESARRPLEEIGKLGRAERDALPVERRPGPGVARAGPVRVHDPQLARRVRLRHVEREPLSVRRPHGPLGILRHHGSGAVVDDDARSGGVGAGVREPRSVRRPRDVVEVRRGLDRRRLERGGVGAVGARDVDGRWAVARRDEREPAAVRRESRTPLLGGARCETPRVAAVRADRADLPSIVAVYAIVRPSGDHAGCDSSTFGVLVS